MRISLLAVFLCLSFCVSAQGRYQDVVYLKNGSVVRGLIVEQVPNISVKIKTADQSVFVYSMEEIDKITKEQPKSRGNLPKNKNYGLRKGYHGIIEFGQAVTTNGNYDESIAKFKFINGYRVNPYFAFGIGTGLKFYNESETVMVPLFADFRVNFLNKRFSPYLSLAGGYAVDIDDDFLEGGPMANIGIGISIRVSKRGSAVHLGLDYDFQQFSNDYYNDPYYGYPNYESNSTAIGLHFAFSW